MDKCSVESQKTSVSNLIGIGKRHPDREHLAPLKSGDARDSTSGPQCLCGGSSDEVGRRLRAIKMKIKDFFSSPFEDLADPDACVKEIFQSKICQGILDTIEAYVDGTLDQLGESFELGIGSRLPKIHIPALEPEHLINEGVSSSLSTERNLSLNSGEISTLKAHEWQMKLFEMLPTITLDRRITVWGAQFYSPSKFFVNTDPASLHLIGYLLQTNCESAKCPQMDPSNIRVGSVVAAKFTDGKWYRGMVTSISDSLFTIYYLDYGNEESVAIEDLMPLPRSVENIPIQTVMCRLHGYDEEEHANLLSYIQGEMDHPKGSFETRKIEVIFKQVVREAVPANISCIGCCILPYYSLDMMVDGKNLLQKIIDIFEACPP